jgi:hypothetical protein
VWGVWFVWGVWYVWGVGCVVSVGCVGCVGVWGLWGCGRCEGVGSLLTFDIPQTALVATLDTYDFTYYYFGLMNNLK